MVKDFAINIFASGIVTVVLQIILYPYFGKKLNMNDYGILLTTMAFVNVIASSLGNSLNNVRLLKNNNYKEPGDFNIILLYGIIFSSVITLLLSLILFKHSIFNSILLVILTSLSLVRQYVIVCYRLKLDFQGLLINNIIICIGYFCGLILSIKFNDWIFAFIFGELFGVLHCLKKSKLLREKTIKTKKFKDTFSSYIHLIVSILFGQSMLYMDRFMIMPFLGSKMVSVYTVSSFAGKTLGIFTVPISSVLLSYFTNKNFKFTVKKLNIFVLIIIILSIIALVVIQLSCPYFLPVLYPKIYNEAIPYLYLSNIGSILTISSNLLQTSIMKIANTKYQIYIQLIFVLCFVMCSLTTIKMIGLYAICVSMIFANIIKILYMIYIGNKTLRNDEVLK